MVRSLMPVGWKCNLRGADIRMISPWMCLPGEQQQVSNINLNCDTQVRWREMEGERQEEREY